MALLLFQIFELTGLIRFPVPSPFLPFPSPDPLHFLFVTLELTELIPPPLPYMGSPRPVQTVGGCSKGDV
jgi:hypothetical protein